ncbi:MAG: Gfo/Idh/MocA family protein [Planctomycetota bacterium]
MIKVVKPNISAEYPLPTIRKPIVIIGAGGVVRQAHLPAYSKAGFTINGIFDIQQNAACDTASIWNIDTIYHSLRDAASAENVIFDVAVPADQILRIVRALPDRSAVLIQKPLGRNIAEARKIVALCKFKKLRAAVNFQLRFAPGVLAIKEYIRNGKLGEIVDIEVRVNTNTPWGQWEFLKGIPRLEILYHSVHYLDCIRSFLGEPRGVMACVAGHPASRGYADVRSSILLHYEKNVRASIYTFHNHPAHSPHAASILKIEGTRGSALLTMGVNLQYPHGEPDALEMYINNRWTRAALPGSWFPDAFAGTMSNLQRFCSGEDRALRSDVNDAAKTMALVEACYISSRTDGTKIPNV